jgi:uncharacterized phage infection (PIP) family protein YhgE
LKKAIIILLLLAIASTTFLALVVLRSSPTTTSDKPTPPLKVPDKKDWTPEDISRDPVGYLAWSDAQVQTQIEVRQSRLEKLSARRAELASKQGELVSKIDEVKNFRNRLETAFERAADEDRWPVRMAGRTFERSKARDILAETAVWLEDRAPLADAYKVSLAKMDQSSQALRNDIRSLGQLREKIALDIERVKLNEGNAELDQLRKTETQLASMSRALSQMSDEQAPTLSETSKSAHVDIDSILK